MQKGQAIIEFILLVLIIVIYLFSTTIPLVEATQNTIQDTENITRANNESLKIVNAIEEVNMFGSGSKKTLTIFVPTGTKIMCDTSNEKISFETTLTQTPFPLICQNGKCTKTFNLTANIQCALGEITGPQKINITVQKTDSLVNFFRSG